MERLKPLFISTEREDRPILQNRSKFLNAISNIARVKSLQSELSFGTLEAFEEVK